MIKNSSESPWHTLLFIEYTMLKGIKQELKWQWVLQPQFGLSNWFYFIHQARDLVANSPQHGLLIKLLLSTGLMGSSEKSRNSATSVILFILHSINSLTWRAMLDYMIQSGKSVLLCRVLELRFTGFGFISCGIKLLPQILFSSDCLRTKLIYFTDIINIHKLAWIVHVREVV